MVESGAVVLSILLAFGIDAAWDGHQLRLREREILSGLVADFEASRPGLESRLELARRMARGTEMFLELTDGRPSPSQVIVPDTLVMAVLGGPTYEPATNTLDAAMASGEVELIGSAALRGELAEWRRILSDTGEDEREVRRITNEQIVPILSRTTNVRPYLEMVLPWSGGDPFAAGRLIGGESHGGLQGRASLTITSELVGAVALRKFFLEFSAADLQDLLATLDRAVARARERLGGES